MKSIFFTTLLAIFANMLLAQFEPSSKINYGNRVDKGALLLSGLISYDKSFDDRETWQFALGSQFPLNKRISIDLIFAYQSDKQEVNFNRLGITANQDQFIFAPGISLFGNVSYGWLQPLVSLAVPFGYITANRDSPNETKARSIAAAISPGLNIYLSKKLALSASLGLISYTSLRQIDSVNSDESFHFGITPADLSIGLILVLGGQ